MARALKPKVDRNCGVSLVVILLLAESLTGLAGLYTAWLGLRRQRASANARCPAGARVVGLSAGGGRHSGPTVRPMAVGTAGPVISYQKPAGRGQQHRHRSSHQST